MKGKGRGGEGREGEGTGGIAKVWATPAGSGLRQKGEQGHRRIYLDIVESI